VYLELIGRLYGWAIMLFDVLLWLSVRDAHFKLLEKLKKDVNAEPQRAKLGAFGSTILRLKRESLTLDDHEHSVSHELSQIKGKESRSWFKSNGLAGNDPQEPSHWCHTLCQKGNFMLRFPSLFRYCQDVVSLINCLYLAAYFTSFIYEAYSKLHHFWIPVVLLTPLPPLICMLQLNPFMIARYLLIRSATNLDVHVLDQVIKQREPYKPDMAAHYPELY